jgi:hypothetical protein
LYDALVEADVSLFAIPKFECSGCIGCGLYAKLVTRTVMWNPILDCQSFI